MPKTIGLYAKFYVALMAALYTLANSLADGHLTAQEMVYVAIAAGSAISVYIVPNARASEGLVPSGAAAGVEAAHRRP
jgi:hypothetical protein